MNKLLILAIVALLAYAGGRYVQPPKVETKIQEVEVVKHDIRVVERIITHPDGTTETNRTTEDKSTETTKKKSETVVTNQHQYRAGLLVIKDADKSLSSPVYGANIEKRFIGPVFLGAYVNTNRDVGLSVSLEF